MGEVLPFPGRVARQASKTRRQTGRFTGLRPDTLARILTEAERGKLSDWADLCDRMVWFDPHIRANLITRIAAIAGARMEFEPTRSGDPKRDLHSEAAVKFLEERHRESDWVQPAVTELLSAIGVGPAVEELDYVWTGQHWTIENARFVPQRQLQYGTNWELELVDFGDRRLTAGRPLSTWPRKFIVHEPREYAGSPSCTGVLRSVAWFYLFKRWAYEFWVHGAERFAWPTVVGSVKKGASKEVRDEFLQTLRDITTQQRGVKEAGDEIDYLESQFKDAGTWKELVLSLNAEIGKAILGSVDQTEASEIGAWKAVESRKATTVDSRMALDEMQIASTWRRDVLTPWLEFNTHLFDGVMPPVPRGRWVIAEKRQEIPAHLISTGAFTRNEVRASIAHPPRDDGDELVSSSADAPPDEDDSEQ